MTRKVGICLFSHEIQENLFKNCLRTLILLIRMAENAHVTWKSNKFRNDIPGERENNAQREVLTAVAVRQ